MMRDHCLLSVFVNIANTPNGVLHGRGFMAADAPSHIKLITESLPPGSSDIVHLVLLLW